MDQPIEDNCPLSIVNSTLAAGSAFDSLDPDLQDLVSDIAKRIYDGEKITYDPDLLHHTAKPLVDGIQKGYGKSIVDVEYNSPDYKALENLTRNAFQFSASKDFHILQDMTNALRDGDRVRSFDEFRAEVDKINVKYNQNWLRTEYNQAIAASQATARWQEFQENAKAMPFLQYQAVMDASTRPDHQKLHGVIKRIDNPFWNTHFPPLGWGCRCEVVQLPGRNHKETPDGSFQKPDVPPQFRENFGKKQQLFSDKHPYYEGVSKEVQAKADQAYKEVVEIAKEKKDTIGNILSSLLKNAKKKRRRETCQKMNEVLEPISIVQNGNGHLISIGFNKKGNSHLYSDTLGRCSALSAEDLLDLPDMLASATFVEKRKDTKGRTDDIKRFYYYRYAHKGKIFFINVAETDFLQRRKLKHKRFVYSITDKI